MAVECCTCPVAVPTDIAGAAGLMLVTGDFGAKYRPDAPESTIAVDDNGGGLQLVDCNFLLALNLATYLVEIPLRHKPLRQPAGRQLEFFSNLQAPRRPRLVERIPCCPWTRCPSIVLLAEGQYFLALFSVKPGHEA